MCCGRSLLQGASLTLPRVGKLCSPCAVPSPRGKAPPHYGETLDRLRAAREGHVASQDRHIRSPVTMTTPTATTPSSLTSLQKSLSGSLFFLTRARTCGL